MHPNETTISRFYAAFAELDADTMATCYAEDATFEDPAFTLRGRREVAGMWHMLCDATRGRQEWKLEVRDIHADANVGHAHWEVRYRFSMTKRRIYNIIEADFTFNPQGLIVSHKDHFDLWRWSRQALGMGGVVLGWTGYFKKQMRQQTRAALDKYLASRP